MVRPIDQEIIAIDKIIVKFTDPKRRRGYTMPRGATRGNIRVSQEAERVRGKCEQEALLWFLWDTSGEAR